MNNNKIMIVGTGNVGASIAFALLNQRTAVNEIVLTDIIAKDGEMLVIVEVKARKNEDITSAVDAVNKQKMRNLVRAAHNYIMYKKLDCDTRFDIITLILDEKGEYRLNHIKDAFYPEINI